MLVASLGLTTFPAWRDYLPLWRRASILVLPFKNLGSDRGQDYVADAVTYALTTDLSRLHNIIVISLATAFTFKGEPVDTKKIGREIGVRYLVEGSISRVGGRVQTNAQLIEARSGTQPWADRFANDFPDLLTGIIHETGRGSGGSGTSRKGLV
ncbi:MAG TPA: hypothetical protein VJ770_16945 [Stellaceae bacterium]|nr:hypothetical protein [Stellaceae bacterium]